MDSGNWPVINHESLICKKCRKIQVTININSPHSNCCDECLYKSLTPYHYKECEYCRKILGSRITEDGKCFACFEEAGEYSLPMCSQHYYCKYCINGYRTQRSPCTKCSLFFISSKNSSRCFICDKSRVPYSNYKCLEHYVCEECLNFFRMSDYIGINDLRNCEKCKVLIRLKSSEEIKNEIKKLASYADNCSECSNGRIFNSVLKLCYNCTSLYHSSKKKSSQSDYECLKSNTKNKDCLNSYDNKCSKCSEEEIYNPKLKLCYECVILHYKSIKNNLPGKDLKNNISKIDCYSCVANAGELSLPQCQQHKYCRQCLKVSKNEKVKCSSCIYFFSIQKDNKHCFICGKFDYKHYSSECKNHSICEICLEFLQSNKVLEIEVLNNCDVCSNKIKLNNEENTKRHKLNTAMLPTKAEELCKECNTRKIFYNDIQSCYSCSNKVRARLTCRRCYEKSPETYNTPTCTVHLYCENCLKLIVASSNEQKLGCSDCYKYFRFVNTDRSKNAACNLCPSSETSELSCQIHRYCKSCCNFLKSKDYTKYPNIKNCLNCVNNLKSIIENQLYPSNNEANPYSTLEVLPQNSFQESLIIQDGLLNSFQYSTGDLFSSNYSYNLKSVGYCNNCNTEEAYTTFICKHNYCIECFLAFACIRIYEFFCQYDNGQNPAVLKQQFFYKCKISGCQKKIMIPSKMVRSYLSITLSDRFTPKKVEYFMQMKTLYLRIFEILNETRWMPYLDGIKSFLAF